MKYVCDKCGAIKESEETLKDAICECKNGKYMDMKDKEKEKEEDAEEDEDEEEDKVKEAKIAELVKLIVSEKSYEFTKKFKELYGDSIKEAMAKEKEKVLKKYSDKKDEEDDVDDSEGEEEEGKKTEE